MRARRRSNFSGLVGASANVAGEAQVMVSIFEPLPSANSFRIRTSASSGKSSAMLKSVGAPSQIFSVPSPLNPANDLEKEAYFGSGGLSIELGAGLRSE